MVAAWLFAAFSFYLSEKTGADWFTRSGAVMALVGAAVTFRLANFYQRALATALKEELVSVLSGLGCGAMGTCCLDSFSDSSPIFHVCLRHQANFLTRSINFRFEG